MPTTSRRSSPRATSRCSRICPERVGGAVAAVADAKDGEGVVVHCFAGKDRTGIVSALLLSLAGVPDELIAADYAASDPGVELLSTPWFESARDETELTIRRRVSTSPRAAMVDVLAWLHETAGGAGRVPAGGRAVGSSARDVARAARAEWRLLKPGAELLAAARLRPPARHCVRKVLQLVAERLELPAAAAMLERPRQQPVGELGIARQQRPVEVGADRRTDAAALEARRRRRCRGPRQRVQMASHRCRAASGRRGSRIRRPSSWCRRRGRPRAARHRSAASRRRASRAGTLLLPASTSRRGRGSRARAAGSRHRRRALPCLCRRPAVGRRPAPRGRAR